MSAIVVAGDTSGSVTLNAPAVSGTTVITLPTTSGTMITTASSGQSIPKAALPTGSVLQVVNVTYSTQVSSSTNTFVDTGLTASITPTSATSKILALVQVNGVQKLTGNTRGQFKLFRNSTEVMYMDDYAGETNSTANNAIGTVGTTYLDSPATTSSTAYKVQFCSGSNVAQVRINTGNGTSTITLMEIAA
jgi:hypothetical protein